MSWLRRRLWLVAPVSLVAVAGGAYVAGGDADETRWERVEKRDLVLTADVTGELRAVRTAGYGPPPLRQIWDFRIASMVPEGTTVGAGDVILEFDATQLRQRLERNLATRDSAQKNLEKRQTDVEMERRREELALAESEGKARKARLKADVPPEVVARKELRIAEIDRRLAEAELEYRRSRLDYLDQKHEAELGSYRQRRDRAQRRVDELESQIEQMTVRAQEGGTVIYRSGRDREKKKVGDRCWRNEVVLEIPDLSQMMATVEADEVELGRLAVGQSAKLRLDAYPDAVYTARVEVIRNTVEQPSRRNPRKVVRLELALDTTDTETMRPGMRLTGEIEVERREDVLTVPLAAVVSGPEGPTVTVSSVGERQVAVELGARQGEWVEVMAGLEQGDLVARRDGP